MPKTITQLTDIGRPPAQGDLYVIETPTGTRSVGAEMVTGQGALKKHHYTALGNETEIPIPEFETSRFSAVFMSGKPLDQYNGPLPVPGGKYKNDFPQSRILLGDMLHGDEEVFILHY